MKMNGGQALIKSLEMEGVEVVFGLPGGAILPVYDPIIDSPIRHILVRHEQGAGHMAEGFAHATGRPGVAMVTSGPGATNIVTPLADAMMDSIPMVVITGQVPSAAIGTDAFQECDIVGVTRSITKHNELVTSAQDIPRVIHEAFHIATTGRPGPVLVDIPKDLVDPNNPNSAMEWYWPDSVDLPGYKPTVKGHPRMIREAAKLIAESERPVIYAGGGILKARAAEALRELAELTGISVVTTLMARGAFPDSHPLCLGMPGMHGNYTAITSMQRSDLLIALGSRFDDRVTGKVGAFAPGRQDHPRRRRPRRAGQGAPARRPHRRRLQGGHRGADQGGPRDRDAAARPLRVGHPAQAVAGPAPAAPTTRAGTRATPSKPQFCIEQLRDGSPEDTIVVSGVGQHQMWSSQFWRFNHPYTWINSGGLGTMGFAVPAAIGAKVGMPGKTVWAIDGDGCFQMTAQELVTASAERIPVKVAILNNAYLGMVRQWQELFYEERYSEVYLSPDLPDYKMWAEAMGCVGMRVEHPDEVAAAVEKANSIDDRPVVIDFRVDWTEKVYPMVAAGTSNDKVILGPEMGEGGH